MEFNIFPVYNHSLQSIVSEIIKVNEYTKKFDLILNYNDALKIANARNFALKSFGRIEFSKSVIGNIIKSFCDSEFINQDTYADVLEELIEMFYYFKNETLDLISDDELISLMKQYYEHQCRGSLELLRHRELEKLSKNIRYGIKDFENIDEDKITEEYEGDVIDE